MLDPYDWYDRPEEEPTIVTRVKLIHETEKAYLFEHEEGKFWTPKAAVVSFDGDILQLHHWFKPKRLPK